ncbi:MAG: DUF1853 family protein [Cryomorphaceae bacterium]|nr:DUF1853 family protein [Flavobacteriales bacterium]
MDPCSHRIQRQWEGFWNSPDMAPPVSGEIKPFEPPEFPIFSKPGDLGNIPLGKRAEKFFVSGIESGSRYKMVAQNIQLIEEGVTRGEIDFILKDQLKNEYVHLELAYKLYLCDEREGQGLECWIGPNRRDRLVDKLEKMHSRQFPKLYHPGLASLLETQKIDVRRVVQALYIPGQLFTPFYGDASISNLNSQAWAGTFMGMSDFKKMAQRSECFVPQKQDWMIDPHYCSCWKTGTRVIPEVEEKLSQSRSPMVWIKDRNNVVSRCFVVFWKS